MRLSISLGVLSNNPLLRHEIEVFASSAGLNVLISSGPGSWARLDEERISNVDCWLVDDDFFEDEFVEAQDALDASNTAVIYGVEPFSTDQQTKAHERQVLLRKVVAQFGNDQTNNGSDVWVLAASAGGPEAIKEFLDELPSNIPLIFLYAQHVDELGSKVLGEVIGRDAQVAITALKGVHRLEPSQIYNVPVEHSVDLFDGVCVSNGEEWSGAYTPSIEQLLRKVYHAFGARANVIYFSGMGEDGAEIAAEMSGKGCQVWAQSPQSSISPVMPESVISKGICAKIAAPKDLARLLVARTQLSKLS